VEAARELEGAGDVDERRRICLYGDSVILGCIGASLAGRSEFDVIRLAQPSPDGSEFETVDPDVILFDVENGHPGPAFSLLETRPDLLLLGVSPDGNVVRQWSGRQYRELSTDELTVLMRAGSEAGSILDGHLVTEPHRLGVRQTTGGTNAKGRV
jgi:hypothetical protein